MAKGGARATSGPAPDPMALRRDRPSDAAGWTTLPSERTGDPPEWPLAEQTEREVTLWVREWRRPQAVMWERNGQELEVAMYVRTLIDAESHEAKAATRTLLRQQQEALGISLPGLARNRWLIADQGEQSTQARGKPQAPASARGRFTVVPGGKADGSAAA